MRFDRDRETPIEELLASCQFIRDFDEIKFGYTFSRWALQLENPAISMDEHSGRLFMMGNEHRDIYNFARILFHLRPDIYPPLSIVNLDEHIDDSKYSPRDIPDGIGLNASWQRYFVENGYTRPDMSFNIWPHKSAVQSSEFAVEKGVIEYRDTVHSRGFIPDVATVDMDFFNGKRLGRDEIANAATGILSGMAGRSQALMMFFSPTFTRHTNAMEISRPLFYSQILTPADPR